jgi:hypothetical protein
LTSSPLPAAASPAADRGLSPPLLRGAGFAARPGALRDVDPAPAVDALRVAGFAGGDLAADATSLAVDFEAADLAADDLAPDDRVDEDVEPEDFAVDDRLPDDFAPDDFAAADVFAPDDRVAADDRDDLAAGFRAPFALARAVRVDPGVAAPVLVPPARLPAGGAATSASSSSLRRRLPMPAPASTTLRPCSIAVSRMSLGVSGMP